jgi:integrase
MRGHIEKRSANSYRIAVSAGFDPVTGKRKQVWRTVRGTRKLAEQELTKLLRDVDSGSLADPGRITVGEYLEKWLAHVRTRVRARTYERYSQIVRNQLTPNLGAIRLAKLTPLQIQAFYGKALSTGRFDGKGGLSARTVLHLHRVLSGALRQSVRWQLLTHNPAAATQPPRPERPQLQIVDPDLANSIFSKVGGTRMEVPVALALGVGMRRGEILALRWSDVDLTAGVVRITRTLQQTAEGLVVEEPKTERSRRSVTLPEFVIQSLRRHRKVQGERRLLCGEAWKDGNLVIERGDGAPWAPDTFSNDFADFASKNGVGRVRFHDLRHGHATLMLSQGVHPKVVSERLGHAGVAITLDTYSHVIPSLQAEAARVMDHIISGQG